MASEGDNDGCDHADGCDHRGDPLQLGRARCTARGGATDGCDHGHGGDHGDPLQSGSSAICTDFEGKSDGCVHGDGCDHGDLLQFGSERCAQCEKESDGCDRGDGCDQCDPLQFGSFFCTACERSGERCGAGHTGGAKRDPLRHGSTGRGNWADWTSEEEHDRAPKVSAVESDRAERAATRSRQSGAQKKARRKARDLQRAEERRQALADAKEAVEAAALAQGSDAAAQLEETSVVSLEPLAKSGHDGFIGWTEDESAWLRKSPPEEAVRIARARIQANPQEALRWAVGRCLHRRPKPSGIHYHCTLQEWGFESMVWVPALGLHAVGTPSSRRLDAIRSGFIMAVNALETIGFVAVLDDKAGERGHE